ANVRERFLHGFARRALLDRLAVLHEARGRSPIAAARFDRALAQQQLGSGLDDASGDDARILIMNDAARGADVAWPIVAFRHFPLDRMAAVGAELHGW